MLKLYYAPGACSFVPHAALEIVKARTGNEFETQNVRLHKGENRTPEYLALNPDAQVPILFVDGEPLRQIVAICDYLDRRFPEVGLLPVDPWQRAQAMSWLAWMNNTVHPTFTHVFRPENYVDDEAARAQIRRHAAVQYRALLERIQARLADAAPFWFGAAPTFHDAYALTLFRWGGFAGLDPQSLPAYRAFVARVAEAPPLAAAIAREGIKLDTYRPA
jgi:glutathione S-transferase